LLAIGYVKYTNMHPGLSSLIYKTLCLEKLSVSSTFILISSVFIRVSIFDQLIPYKDEVGVIA
jgi:hypothetical protein